MCSETLRPAKMCAWWILLRQALEIFLVTEQNSVFLEEELRAEGGLCSNGYNLQSSRLVPCFNEAPVVVSMSSLLLSQG